MELQESNCELIGQLKQMNTRLMAELATASQLVSSLTSAPLASQPQAKPFKEWILQVDAYSGLASSAQGAFLAHLCLYARQNSVPDRERPRKLVSKLPSCGTP